PATMTPLILLTSTSSRETKSSTAIIQMLLQARAHIDAKDGRENTALRYAITQNKPKTAQLLILAGADLNCPNKQRQTPLGVADDNQLETIETAQIIKQHIDT